jgi:hypothetical protein
VSVFSKLNNLRDISMSEAFATMYGYTQEEVEHYFGDRVYALADKNKADRIEYHEKSRNGTTGSAFTKMRQQSITLCRWECLLTKAAGSVIFGSQPAALRLSSLLPAVSKNGNRNGV